MLRPNGQVSRLIETKLFGTVERTSKLSMCGWHADARGWHEYHCTGANLFHPMRSALP